MLCVYNDVTERSPACDAFAPLALLVCTVMLLQIGMCAAYDRHLVVHKGDNNLSLCCADVAVWQSHCLRQEYLLAE